MIIGIPKEQKEAEKRISLTPCEVSKLVKEGFTLYIEENAGVDAGYTNDDYSNVGATIVTQADLYKKAELIVKVKEPVEADLRFLQKHHSLFCYLHMAGNPHLSKAFKDIGLTEAYAFETVKIGNTTPLLAPMSAIAGRLSVQIGTNLLHKSAGGMGKLLGGFTGHSQGVVTIIGAGVAGTEAAKAALGAGAEVHILDVNKKRLTELQEELPHLITHISTQAEVNALLPKTDLLIGSVYLVGQAAPHVVSNKQLKLMQKAAVAIDISIDQGGCFEFSEPCTHTKPYIVKEGVIVSAITNLPGTVPLTASEALSEAIYPYVIELAKKAPSEALKHSKI